MESFALTLFVLCTCMGLLSVAVMTRWLRSQPAPVPDLALESVPSERIVEPLEASAGVAAMSRHHSVLPDDDPTQPMARTQAWGPGELERDASDWPTTVLEPSQRPDAAQAKREPDGVAAADEFADTQPLPVSV